MKELVYIRTRSCRITILCLLRNKRIVSLITQLVIFINDYKQTQDLYYYLTKAILTSYSTKEQGKCNFFNFGVCKIETFDRSDFYISIDNLRNKNFIDLLKSLKN